MKAPSSSPAICWHSDPVLPGETVVVEGGPFASDAVLELARAADGEESGTMRWEKAIPLQRSGRNLKAVVPGSWPPGIFHCRVRQAGGVSGEVALNAPDPWWVQGEAGEAAVHPGGRLRIFGKCLAGGGHVRVILRCEGRDYSLDAAEADPFALTVVVPADLPEGSCEVLVHNGFGGVAGWRSAGNVLVTSAAEALPVERNVLDFGADPDGKGDCTDSIVRALEQLGDLGGGTLYFPRGRYRIDAGRAPGGPLRLRPGVGLRGEGADLVSLWWPDQAEPLPTLIHGEGDFAVEDVSIYTQGRHRNIISGNGRARIRRVRIRANCYYMTGAGGRPHHRRSVTEPPAAMGAALELGGEDILVTDCDIYHSSLAVRLENVRGGCVARNTARAADLLVLRGSSSVIFEGNTFEGNQLASGWNGPVFSGAACRHVYFARNSVSHVYGGRRGEARENWDGAGQPSAAECDAAPHCVGGRHLIIGNTVQDSGAPGWLEPLGCESIVAANRVLHGEGLGAVEEGARRPALPHWGNQFLDNQVSWGGDEVHLRIWGEDESVGKDEARQPGEPLVRAQIVRRHQVDGGGCILVGGGVRDVLIEGCVFRDCETGIRIDAAAEGVLLRNNAMDSVARAYSGSAVDAAEILTETCTKFSWADACSPA